MENQETLTPVLEERPHTYQSIADEYGVTKRTVEIWYKQTSDQEGNELGMIVDVGRGVRTRRFTDMEKLLITSGKIRQEPKIDETHDADEVLDASFIDPIEPTSSAIERIEVNLPEHFDPKAAATRFDGAALNVTDPSRILEACKLMLTQAEAAIDDKIAAQRQELAEHEQVLDQLQELKQEKLTTLAIAGLESRMLARQQNSTTQKLQELLSDISNLGKRPEATSESA